MAAPLVAAAAEKPINTKWSGYQSVLALSSHFQLYGTRIDNAALHESQIRVLRSIGRVADVNVA
jgi:hypothetical protein